MSGRDLARDRAMATLFGGALGDALGMPTQLLSPDEIERTYGFVDRFVEPSIEHPVSKGLPAGMITDDTEQTLLLGGILLQSEDSFDHGGWVDVLIGWERDVKARGSYDLLGPSTKRAIDAIKNGVAPEEAGSSGTTNGAAMRIAPVGIMIPPEPLEALVAKVAETCQVTHNTSLAIASAAAVAATISRGIASGTWREAVAHARVAAALGAKHGRWVAAPDIGARIVWARELVRGKPMEEAIRLIVTLVGTGVAAQESVPAAFAVLEAASGDPWQAAIISANLGGDTDTIGAIAASMAAACSGMSRLPSDKIAALKGLDPEQLRALATDLVAARFRRISGEETV